MGGAVDRVGGPGEEASCVRGDQSREPAGGGQLLLHGGPHRPPGNSTPPWGGGAGALAPSSDPPCDLAFPEATGFHWTGPVVQEGFLEHQARRGGGRPGGGCWATAGAQRTQATPVYTPANREGLWLLQGVTLHVLVKHGLYLYGRRNGPPGSRGWSSAE